MKTFSALLAVHLSLGLCVTAFATAADTSHAAPAGPPVILDANAVQNLRIETAIAEETDFETTVFALGQLEVYPGNRAAISSRIAGRAITVHVRHDHAIKAGEPAFVIESRQPGNPPPQVTLPAPISGLISRVDVVPGEPVSPDKALAEIIDLRKIYALARVPEHLASALRAGQTARVLVPAVGPQPFTATLEHLGVLADPANGTIEAAFHLDNPDLVLRPGMRAEFAIVTSRRSGVMSVPRAALQGDAANRFVYVKDFDLPHAFHKTPVVVGETNDRAVEIIRGLLPADEVVTRGAYSLAFVGSGSVSLKDALDAAHGHAHAADGSELKGDAPATTKSATPAADAHAGHDHADHGHAHDDHDDHDHATEHPERPWMILSGVLFIALVVVSALKRRAAPPAPEGVAPNADANASPDPRSPKTS